jgi:amino acid permease
MLFLTIYVAIVAYLVLQGDLLPSIVSFAGVGANSFGTNRTLLMSLVALLLVPVGAAPQLKSLRFTSLVSLISIYFLAGIIVYKCIHANVRNAIWFSSKQLCNP